MDMSSFRNTIILFIAILYIHSAFALKCHDCNSIDSPDCKDNVKAKFIHTCGTPSYSQNVVPDRIFFKVNHPVSDAATVTWRCAKLVARNSTLSVTARTCFPKTDFDACQKVAEELKKIEATIDHCSLCDSDLCNSSSSFSISYYSIGILVFVFTFMK